jgi:hypothetical protein
MDFSQIIILMARQRSGTNALRSVLESHPEIYCHNEVFSFNDRVSEKDPLLPAVNFFNFLLKYAREDLTRILPHRHEVLFLDFIEYLRCFSSKRYIVIDVKYNTTHFLTEPYKWVPSSPTFAPPAGAPNVPYLFFLIKRCGLRVINITRRNYLRYVLSESKAQATRVWQLREGAQATGDRSIRISDTEALLRRLACCRAEDMLVDGYFADYGRFISYEYDNVFGADASEVSADVLSSLSKWLQVINSFERKPTFRKQSHLPLDMAIANFEEVAAALRGTEFEYCLEDERMYRPLSTGSLVPDSPTVY